MAEHGCTHYTRLVSSALGVIFGLFASGVFFIFYQHTIASVWAFISAIFAAVCLMLHILHHRNMLSVWHSADTLNDITVLGFAVFVIGLFSTIWYLFDGFYHHRALLPIEGCPYITAVWSFMTGKWGLLLWSCSRTYSRLLSNDGLPLLMNC